jgi:hypothetical protein
VDPLTLIVSALVAGAAAAGKDVASSAIKDAYRGLKKLLIARFHHKEAAEAAPSPSTAVGPVAVLEAHEAQPDTWAAPLKEALAASGADHDQEILDVAKSLLEQADPQGSAAGKYRIDLRGAQGVQVGDRGQMTVNINSFRSRSGEAPHSP